MIKNEAPKRMCIVCREMKEKQELIRIVRGNEIKIDYTFKAPGRGAYVCRNEQCKSKLIKHRLLNKAFKSEISCEIYNKLTEELNEQ